MAPGSGDASLLRGERGGTEWTVTPASAVKSVVRSECRNPFAILAPQPVVVEGMRAVCVRVFRPDATRASVFVVDHFGR